MNIHPELAAGLKWGSHLPAIAACFSQSIGPVLEVGVGHFSTPFLHALCLPAGRTLISVEADSEWGQPFKDKYLNPGHEFILGDYYAELTKLTKTFQPLPFGLSFIDNSPGGMRRAQDFATLLPFSRYLVVHDYEQENVECIEPLLAGLEYHVMRAYSPPTLVVASCGATLPLVISSF